MTVWIALGVIAVTLSSVAAYIIISIRRLKKDERKAGADEYKAATGAAVVETLERMDKAGAENRDTLNDLDAGKF